MTGDPLGGGDLILGVLIAVTLIGAGIAAVWAWRLVAGRPRRRARRWKRAERGALEP